MPNKTFEIANKKKIASTVQNAIHLKDNLNAAINIRNLFDTI